MKRYSILAEDADSRTVRALCQVDSNPKSIRKGVLKMRAKYAQAAIVDHGRRLEDHPASTLLLILRVEDRWAQDYRSQISAVMESRHAGDPAERAP